jgi:hypothetical protein
MFLKTWLCKPFDGCIIKFEDTFIEKDFPFFEPVPVHLQSKFTKSVNKSQKEFLLKISIWVSKNPEFYADLESIEKVWKNVPEKVISKNRSELCTFLFTHDRQTCIAYNFFCSFFNNFFNGFKISVKFCVFLYLF